MDGSQSFIKLKACLYGVCILQSEEKHFFVEKSILTFNVFIFKSVYLFDFIFEREREKGQWAVYSSESFIITFSYSLA